MATKHDVVKDELGGYLKASRKEKKLVLNRLEQTIKMHRKSIVRRFRVLQTRKEGYDWSDTRGRRVYYTPDVTAALREVWDISHELCAERLKEEIGNYIRILKRDGMWKHSDETTGKLLSMSVGTMKNRLSAFERVLSGGGRNLTKPSSLKEAIPVRRGPWENPPPGTGELDTVGHCGNTAEGLFGYTTQYTDIYLLWCFLEAQMGKGKVETLQSIQAMNERSPFRIKGLDPDTGSEFINWNIKEWCDTKRIELTRIRPGMKNDHGRIEQKNDKNVRKWAGYIRIDTEERLDVLKELYRTLEVYINHFQPSMKCVKKVRYNISHSSRMYDKAQTPYKRFMDCPETSRDGKEKMKKFHNTLNPKVLHDELLRIRKKLFAGAKFTQSE